MLLFFASRFVFDNHVFAIGLLSIATAFLGVGCILFLLIGAAMGSKARRAVKNGTDK